MVYKGHSQDETLCAIFVTAIRFRFCKIIGGWAGPAAIDLEAFKVYLVTLSAMFRCLSKSGQKTLASYLQDFFWLVWTKINLVSDPRVGDPSVAT